MKNMIAIKEIKIGRRHRKDLGDLGSLKTSIQEVGLLHPVVLAPGKRLVAGLRRIRAFEELDRTEIPAVEVKTLAEAGAQIKAEIAENVCRKDMTPAEAWGMGKALEPVEKAEAAKRQEEAGERGKEGGRGKKKPSGEKPQRVCRARDAIAAMLNMDGRTWEKLDDVMGSGDKEAKARLEDTGRVAPAHNTLKENRKKKELRKKAKAAEKQLGNDKLPFKLECDECQNVLPKIRGARLVFADPPYNLGVDYGKGVEDDMLPDELYLAFSYEWINMCAETLTDDGSMWVMICDEWAEDFSRLLREAGLHRRAWIKWYETFGVNCTKNFNRCSRHIFYCVRDPEKFVFNADAVNRESDRQTKYKDKRADPAGKIWDDVWIIPRVPGTAKERSPGFPTQLPLDILRAIVGCASDPGDLVVDPFSGSATTGVAVIELGRRYHGIEKEKKFHEQSRQRLIVAAEQREQIAI